MHAHYLNIFWLNLFDFFFIVVQLSRRWFIEMYVHWWASLFFATSVKFTKRCRLRLYVRFFVVVFAVILQLLFHLVFKVFSSSKSERTKEREKERLDRCSKIGYVILYLACECVWECECIPYVMHCSIVQHCDKLMNVDIKYAPWHYYYILFSMFV